MFKVTIFSVVWVLGTQTALGSNCIYSFLDFIAGRTAQYQEILDGARWEVRFAKLPRVEPRRQNSIENLKIKLAETMRGHPLKVEILVVYEIKSNRTLVEIYEHSRDASKLQVLENKNLRDRILRDITETLNGQRQGSYEEVEVFTYNPARPKVTIHKESMLGYRERTIPLGTPRVRWPESWEE